MPSGFRCPMESPVGGPPIAAKVLRQDHVVGIVGRALSELACQLQCPAVKSRCLVQHDPQRHQVLHEFRCNIHCQFTSHRSPMKRVGYLKGHEMRCRQPDALPVPNLEDCVGHIGIFLFNQLLEGQACVHDDEITHAHSCL